MRGGDEGEPMPGGCVGGYPKAPNVCPLAGLARNTTGASTPAAGGTCVGTAVWDRNPATPELPSSAGGMRPFPFEDSSCSAFLGGFPPGVLLAGGESGGTGSPEREGLPEVGPPRPVPQPG